MIGVYYLTLGTHCLRHHYDPCFIVQELNPKQVIGREILAYDLLDIE